MVDLFGRLGGGVEMNGSEDAVEKMLTFDAQKGKGNHVRYILGKSKMLLGFCEGLPTMLKGEVAMFKIKPKLHYAKDDCTLKASDGFPKDDELHFEIEMLDFYKVKILKEMATSDVVLVAGTTSGVG
ncbi:Peptidylprolyl isomerase protein [Dioscorea alata]|uniref:Peptidylprolyl isomerase protein n=2 Tax=Dioscorea alata TaxID=55571 RepID=A0ACB7UC77_DIOAL|nr:Peptidylprolyl isomerase protein [Dioscorea alata]KAH7657920.1 Peptidylprolyl isomerase protein [Dioscorea alata]